MSDTFTINESVFDCVPTDFVDTSELARYRYEIDFPYLKKKWLKRLFLETSKRFYTLQRRTECRLYIAGLQQEGKFKEVDEASSKYWWALPTFLQRIFRNGRRYPGFFPRKRLRPKHDYFCEDCEHAFESRLKKIDVSCENCKSIHVIQL